MLRVSLVTEGVVAALHCPYCGCALPRDPVGVSTAQALWGFAGVIATDGEAVVGLLLVSAVESPGRGSTAAAISTGWVDPARVRQGLGKQLVRRLAAGLHQHQVRTLLASSDRTLGCAAFPWRWLAAVGFVPTIDRRIWRLDLGQALTHRSSLRASLRALADSVRPLPPPEPIGRAPRAQR